MQQTPIGSAHWIEEESRLAEQYIDQEVEEFTYSVRNEIEWLNEHMLEVFSRGQLCVATSDLPAVSDAAINNLPVM